MIDVQLLSVLFLGMMVGIFHAFDADHVVAMATLVNQKSMKKHVLLYAIKWGGGHGGTLLILGCLLVFVGIELPSWFVHYAEVMVGLLLIYLGIRLWLFLTANRAQDNDAINSVKSTNKDVKHDHAPLFIGMLHGVAGSAPVLALLPSMLESQFLLHVLLFSVGCLLGMFCFGLVWFGLVWFGLVWFGLALGTLQAYIKQLNTGMTLIFARLLSVSSIGLGSYWIFN